MTGVVQLRLEEKREPVAAEKVGSGADPVVYEKLRCLRCDPLAAILTRRRQIAGGADSDDTKLQGGLDCCRGEIEAAVG